MLLERIGYVLSEEMSYEVFFSHVNENEKKSKMQNFEKQNKTKNKNNNNKKKKHKMFWRYIEKVSFTTFGINVLDGF